MKTTGLHYTKWSSAGILGLGLPLVLAMVFAAGGLTDDRASAICGGALCAAAPFAIGAILGFLFGIPRTLQGAGDPDSGKTTYRVNTNLEQISDWLTKILVGVGLTQIREMPALAVRAARYSGRAFGNSDRATSGALLILVYFLAAGFIAGYLVTRIVLTPALADADARANPEAVRRLNDAPFRRSGTDADGALVSNVASADTKEVLRFSMEDLESPSELTAWAKAKLASGDVKAATEGFTRALRAADADVDTDAQRRSAEGLAFAALYRDPPDGFRAALAAIDSYLARPGAKPTAAMKAWEGCAYGQAHDWEKKHDANDAKLAEFRTKALAAVRAAITADPNWKSTLAAALRPSPSDGDDDLSTFAGDQDFVTLLTGEG